MIGVFDSGVGGLSVLKEIRREMPGADLLYVADRARAPYGTRTLEDVREISHTVVRWLVDRGADTVVVACNTASAAALETLRSEFGQTPIVGMEPAVKPAASSSTSGVVAVFATAATFQGRLFDSLVDRHARSTGVVAIACPQWVEMVEMGEFEGSQIAAPVRQALDEGADTLVLGCTHFSFLEPAIREEAGRGITVIDPAAAVAAQTRRVSGQQQGNGTLRLAASGDPGEFSALARTTGIDEPTNSVLLFNT